MHSARKLFKSAGLGSQNKQYGVNDAVITEIHNKKLF